MAKKALILTALMVLFVFKAQASPAQNAPAKDVQSFGHTWATYAEKEKKSFLIGVATAVRMMCMDILSNQKDASPQTIETQARDCFNSYVGYEPEKIIATMNELYADSKNALIPLDGVYKIALMKLHGEKIDEVLAQARKYGEGLKKAIDQEMQKGAGKP